MSLHGELAERLIEHYGPDLAESPRLSHDAVTAIFQDGLALELRFAGAEEYALRWRRGEAELCIDTAPLHRQLATFPHHLHDDRGGLRADPVTQPGREPWENVRALVDRIRRDPLLAG